jgi:CAAX prenyl protease-like protein
MTAVALTLAVLAFYAFFFRRVVRHWGGLAELVVGRLRLGSTRPVREIEAIGKLMAAGIAQALFVAVLLLVFGTDLGSITAFSPDLLALGALLGFGELALASFLATAVVQLDLQWRSDERAVSAWLAQGRGGWMGQFAATVAAAPAWFACASVALYVVGEEIVFRGIVIDVAAGAGAGVAVTLSLTLFVVVQAFNMPSVRAATFPMVGAVVVGAVHGILFWQTYNVLPLVVAHLTFFAGALVLAAPARRSAWAP